MNYAFQFINTCSNCGKHSLKILTENGVLINLENNSLDIDKTELIGIKCTSCGKVFLIDWTKPVFAPYTGQIEI